MGRVYFVVVVHAVPLIFSMADRGTQIFRPDLKIFNSSDAINRRKRPRAACRVMSSPNNSRAAASNERKADVMPRLFEEMQRNKSTQAKNRLTQQRRNKYLVDHAFASTSPFSTSTK